MTKTDCSAQKINLQVMSMDINQRKKTVSEVNFLFLFCFFTSILKVVLTFKNFKCLAHVCWIRKSVQRKGVKDLWGVWEKCTPGSLMSQQFLPRSGQEVVGLEESGRLRGSRAQVLSFLGHFSSPPFWSSYQLDDSMSYVLFVVDQKQNK